MGLLGLRKFIDSTGSTRLLPVPLSEEEAVAQAEQQQQQQQHVQRQRTRPGYGGGQRYRAKDSDTDGDGEEHGGDRDERVLLSTSSAAGSAGGDDGVEEEAEDADGDAQLQQQRVPLVDHVLVDMNCIVHSCFGKHDVTVKTKKELIQLVLERLQLLLTKVVSPRKSLTICLDGPAPYAKLQTQRLRRRRVAVMDASAHQLTSLAITAGSLFLVELENALAAQFKLNRGKGFLGRLCPVYLYGSTVMGEGESKISRALAFLASRTAPTDAPAPPDAADHRSSTHSSARNNQNSRNRDNHRNGGTSHSGRDSAMGASATIGDGFSNQAPFYNPNDTVTVLGNDIDLVMTCLGATPFHNISVVGPSALQLISVSDILYRWLRATTTASGGGGGESFRLTPEMLPSMRVDFVYLFLLNGGDHYVGAGEVAMTLWRRYRTVRASYPRSTLVSRQLDILDTDFLVDVLDARGYAGDADPKPGLSLLQSALWSLYTTITGICPDYAYVPEPSSPHLQNLRAAAAFLKKKGRQMKLHFDINSKPLAPLEAYVALMPTEATLPRSVAKALSQPGRPSAVVSHSPSEIGRLLATSNDAGEVAEAAKEAVAVAQPFLSASEKYLCQFTPPVQLNAIPPRQRLSRFEQHRMLATRGEIVFEEPIPMVRKLDITLCGTGFERVSAGSGPAPQHHQPQQRQEREGAAEYFVPPISYTQWRYPPAMDALTFRSPFDYTGCSTGGERGTGADKGGKRRVLLAKAQRESANSAASKATRTAAARLERAMAEASALRSHRAEGSLKSEKRLHAMQRRVERLRQELERCKRQEADEDADAFALSTAKRGRGTAGASDSGYKRPRDEAAEVGHANGTGGEAVDDTDGFGNDAEVDGADEAFLADIQQFLGGAEEAARLVNGDDGATSEKNARKKKRKLEAIKKQKLQLQATQKQQHNHHSPKKRNGTAAARAEKVKGKPTTSTQHGTNQKKKKR